VLIAQAVDQLLQLCVEALGVQAIADLLAQHGAGRLPF
jgi:hypothetical protein